MCGVYFFEESCSTSFIIALYSGLFLNRMLESFAYVSILSRSALSWMTNSRFPEQRLVFIIFSFPLSSCLIKSRWMLLISLGPYWQVSAIRKPFSVKLFGKKMSSRASPLKVFKVLYLEPAVLCSMSFPIMTLSACLKCSDVETIRHEQAIASLQKFKVMSNIKNERMFFTTRVPPRFDIRSRGIRRSSSLSLDR